MPFLIVKCFEHKFRVQPIVVLSRLRGKLCKEMIAWQAAYVLQLPNQEPAAMLYLLDQGKIRTNIYRNTLVRLLQCLPLQQSLKRSQNHLQIQSHWIQEKGKPCQPSRDSLLWSLHYLQLQGELHHQFRRELPLSLPSEVSILLLYQSLPQESQGYPAQKPLKPFCQVQWSLIRKCSLQRPICKLKRALSFAG